MLVALVLVIAAACGNDSTTPTVAPGSTAPAGSGSLSSSTSPSASTKPKVDNATTAITRFVALVTGKGFDFQATFSGELRGTTEILPVRHGLLQVSGDDVLERATLTLLGHRYVVEHRYVNGKAWFRYDLVVDSWHRVPFRPADTMAAFAAIHRTTDVTYLGPIKSGGKTYYRVSIRSAILNPLMIPATNLTDTTLRRPALTLLIDVAGRPIRGTASINATGRVSGQLQEIVIDLKVTFTKVGQAVTIKAP